MAEESVFNQRKKKRFKNTGDNTCQFVILVLGLGLVFFFYFGYLYYDTSLRLDALGKHVQEFNQTAEAEAMFSF